MMAGSQPLIALQSAQNSAGIQTLLDAEREAQKIVQQDRTKRVKEARSEAQREIDEYRKQKEEEFKKFEAEHSSGNKKAEEEANKEAEAQLAEIKVAGQKSGDKVIKDLINAVTDVKPDTCLHVYFIVNQQSLVRDVQTDNHQVHYWEHSSIDSFVVREPMVLGHESSGVVSKVGSKVTTLKVSDQVAMEPGIPCRRREPYKSGKYHLCINMAFAATPPYDGTLTRYYRLPEDFCYKLRENIPLKKGALIEPLGVAVHVVKQAGVVPGNSVVVFGAGPVGLCTKYVPRPV
ncbi:vacuolar ATP synthase subunit G plant, putative [Talaromyces stipitatus ATCC 10500]|uniref:D-xylulose reductase n=1 Tax=Talaromyces stipitatus (strain ATCC 10500 / CBS 375.48 / QM 6759 / NRRL 1006) TaxID=441959 RepID=B8MU18_TALSN|nr:vacuolar ATP synthase subunit G plant, putative [Talaromyces stipitatus ATCC 10500]EED12651.1 vacuolar ATP synthase subunit G plant, putative [Talaromyces stipitatus ATCC 10500]